MLIKSIFIFTALFWLATPVLADGGHTAGSCMHDHDAGTTICDSRGSKSCTTKDKKPGRCVQRTKHCQCQPSGGGGKKEKESGMMPEGEETMSEPVEKESRVG